MTGNDAGNVRLIEVLICVRERITRAIDALTEIQGGLRRTLKGRRSSVTNEKDEKKEYNKEYAMQ